jgi:hypothetical protein
MKKLLLGATFILGSIFSTNAQTTILSQTFGSSIPAGWTQQKTTVDGGWQFGTTFGSNMQAYAPAQGDDAYVDDWDNNTSTPGWDTLKTTVMNCSTYAHVWLSMNYMFWIDDGSETSNIIISTDGGHTWNAAAALTNTNGGWLNGNIFDISSMAGSQASVMVGFTYYNGYPASLNYTAVGMAIENLLIYAPADYDVQVVSQNLPGIMQVGKPYLFTGSADNLGVTGITSMTMNYSVNGGPPVSQAISSIAGFNQLTAYNWSMNTSPFTPSAQGLYHVKYWANPLDGSNTNINTDTLTAEFWAVDSLLVRQAIYEEFTGQSCVYCMLAAPNMDSVYANNATTSNIIRYHVPIPARDFMYDANVTPVNTRESYYGVNGAPFGNLDGVYYYPGGLETDPLMRYSSNTVQADNSAGSPFKIDIVTSKFDAAKDSFMVTANITSYATFAAGLVAQVALTVDSITYKYDLSMDDPQQSFAPPVGTGASGYSYTDCPDYYYDYVLKYTHVAEEMFPNTGSGTSLAAFTSIGQTQTVSFEWKKNHPWGLYDKGAARDSDFYDSSATGQFVVFVQTNGAIAADNIPAKYVFQSASAPISNFNTLGMQEISEGVYFEMYPNPTSNNTNLAFKLEKDQNVTVSVYNMLGEQVYTNNEGTMTGGTHNITINTSALQSGVYFVRFNTNNASTTQKLIIAK